ncbi:D-2-hydroxyacid dehydrogenase family protein [Vibrio sp. MarTm2]|uniref:D-2-hydroxyacid dehydrogenase family protein n=1 Tax=Vibrio sp. MarTm2 TaxID=2998831 RepID=UPI0022CDAE87|nr:D-2-hydroxyacid dehydrogenase family protein [Vibrio sp. MarTm2]MDA0130047.1 D-2-hydroxyacid dehydrogenase family protein [Vibrio sp. MarTm2]
MKIAILDDYQDQVRHLSHFTMLNEHDVTVFTDTLNDVDALVNRLEAFDAIILIRERTVITDELLSRLPNLKLISQTGKISNHLNLDDCTRHRVAVAEGVGSPIAPSELAWALIMATARRLPNYIDNFKHGQWQQSGVIGLGTTLHGKTMGIWGFGKIGQRLAKYAHAFEVDVVVWGSEASREKAVKAGYRAAESKQAFFSQCDIISLNLRLNEATRHIVTQLDLDTMRPDSMLVNISRAELIAPNALYQTLVTHPTKLAAIDVFEHEPANEHSEPLLTLPNVVATPHLGYVEKNSYELYFQWAFENVVKFSAGTPENIANPQALS